MTLHASDIHELTSLWRKVEDVQSLERESRPPIENLVCEGGGVKGLVYAGALKVMEENGVLQNIKRVAGSSAGGIVSLLLAIGYTAEEIEAVMKDEVDFKSLMDRRVEFDPTRVISAAGMKVGISDIALLFKHKGLFKGDAFVELAKHFVARKIEAKLKEVIQNKDKQIIENLKNQFRQSAMAEEEVEQMVDEHIHNRYLGMLDKYYINNASDITFEQLNNLNKDFPELHFKELFVTGTKLSDASLKVFSADTDPNMSIVDAVRITMSFPFGFEPVLYQGEYYADGGIADNYPMQIFDQDKFLTHGLNDARVNPCTLGLLVDSQDEIDARWGVQGTPLKELSLKGFIGGVVAGIHNRSEILRDYYNINSIQIFDENVATMDLNLSDENKQKLLASGIRSMQHYIDNYLGTNVQYSHLPNYEDAIEKYYSKRPEELMRIIEQELWPLMQDLHCYNAILRKINFPKELQTIEENLSLISPDLLNNQIQLFNTLSDLADECEQLQFEDKTLDSKIALLEKEKRLLWERMDTYDKAKISDDDVAKWYAQGSEIIIKINKLNERKEEIKQELEVKKTIFDESKISVDSNVFPLIEQKHRMEMVINSNFVKKLQQSETVLHEHMDMALNALSAYKKDYPDPRVREGLEKDLFVLREKQYEYYVKYFMNQFELDDQAARLEADKYIELYDDLLLFGMPIKDTEMAVTNFFSSMKAISELANPNAAGFTAEDLRNKILTEFLQKEMLSQGLLTDDVDDLVQMRAFWKQSVLNNLMDNHDMKRGYAEYLAKEETLKEWKRRKEQKIQKTIKLRTSDNINHVNQIQHKYALTLNETLGRLQTGKWGDQINLTNREDIEHNLKDMRRDGAESYGKHSSNYTVQTIHKQPEKKGRFLSFKRTYVKPPIKLNILTPQKGMLQNPEHPVKEIILAFESPTYKSKTHNFALISKHAGTRQKYFEEHQEEFLKQLSFAIAKAKEQGIQPPDAKFKITIAGEGLGGQDAQYMLRALVKRMNKFGSASTLDLIKDIELILTDPSRVSNAVAAETAIDIENLKKRSPETAISGYNLIHMHAIAGQRFRRKAQNFIGQANILSMVNPHDAVVVSDIRDSYNSNFQHTFNSNQIDSNALRKQLNHSNWIFQSKIFSRINIAKKEAIKTYDKIFKQALPKFVKFLSSLPFMGVKSTIKSMKRLGTRFVKIFQKKKKIPQILPDWSSKLNHQIKAEKEAVQRDVVQSLTLEDQVEKLLEKASPSARLQREKRPPIENLVLEGGGVKGLVYVGALEEMEKNDQLSDLKRVAGSSAGGIAAALLAVGYSPHELKDIFLNQLDFKKLMDTPYSVGGIDTLFELKGMEIGLTSLISLFKNKGLYKGDVFKQFMDTLIKNKLRANLKEALFKQLTNEEITHLKMVPPFLSAEERTKRIDEYLELKLRDLTTEFGIDDLGKITFKQMNDISKAYPELQLKELYLTGTKISDASLRVFSADSDPDMPIVDAVRITMSFPGGFMPVEYQGYYYADGGIADNYPMQIFDKDKFLSHGVNDSGANPCTLGLLVDSQDEIDARWGLVTNKTSDLKLFDLVGKVLNGMHNRSEILRNKYNINSIQITDNVSTTPTYEGVGVLDLKLSTDSKKRLIQNGRDEMKFYYENYTGSDVGYSHIEAYENLPQKYMSKSALELNRILMNEVLPLIEAYDQIQDKVESKKQELEAELNNLDETLKDYAEAVRLVDKLKAIAHEERVLNQNPDRNLKQLDKISQEKQLVLAKLQTTDQKIIDLIKVKLQKDDELQRLDQVQYNISFVKLEQAAILKALSAKSAPVMPIDDEFRTSKNRTLTHHYKKSDKAKKISVSAKHKKRAKPLAHQHVDHRKQNNSKFKSKFDLIPEKENKKPPNPKNTVD
jgi:predicted acylesterase/phospholipase RssA